MANNQIQHRVVTLRVVHVVLALHAGGSERLVVQLARAARGVGQEVAIVCLQESGILAEHLADEGQHVVCLGARTGLRGSTVARLAGTLRRLKPHVVHTHQINGLLHAGLAAKAAGHPVVVHTQHGDHRGMRLRRRMMARVAGAFAARFFCVSDDVASQTRGLGIPQRKLAVVANGVDIASFSGQPGAVALRQSMGFAMDAQVVGTVSRLVPVKRQDILLKAFVALHRRNPRARLLLVGAGPEQRSLEQLATRLKIAPFVHFAGYQRQVAEYLAAMDVFVLTSESEGCPLAMLEAAAAGIPIVASRVGGLPDFVKHAHNGLLCEPLQPESFAAAIESVLADSEFAKQLAAAAWRAVVARNDIRKVATQYHEHYLELLGFAAGTPLPALSRDSLRSSRSVQQQADLGP